MEGTAISSTSWDAPSQGQTGTEHEAEGPSQAMGCMWRVLGQEEHGMI